MEKCREKDGIRPGLLDLNVGERDCWDGGHEEQRRTRGCTDENKLELRLAPPGGVEEDDWKKMKTTQKNSGAKQGSILSLGCFSEMEKTEDGNGSSWFLSSNSKNGGQIQKLSSLSSQRLSSTVTKESSRPCNTKLVDLQQQSTEMVMMKKAFSSRAEKTAVSNSSQKRAAPGPVVGWPPIRSFRKNLATTSSSKPPATDSPGATPSKPPTKEPASTPQKGLFVKINMDGVPIGRKVDLRAYDTYEKLSGAVDELFRGLLAAQRDSSSGGGMQKDQEAITGLLDGSGEYTLVYEDNEGDRMLVGDVPWHMFVSTVKRLRVLRSSELSKLHCGSKQGKTLVGVSR